MTEGQQLFMDIISGGLALMILRYLDRWFRRAKKNQIQTSDHPR